MLLAGFVATRGVAYLAGVRFDARPLAMAFQTIDGADFRADYLGSVWFAHAQPPLFNAVMGVVHVVAPNDAETVVHVSYLGLGLLLTALLFRLCGVLGASHRASLVVTGLVMVSPQVLLYEAWAMYEYPLAVAFVGLLLCAARYARSGASSALAGVAALSAVLMLSRSLVHPGWYLVLLVGLFLVRPPVSGFRVVGIVVVPLLAVGVVVTKNGVLFGEPITSSLLGQNLQHVAIDQLPAEVREALVADGSIAASSNVSVFGKYANYEPFVEPCTRTRPDVPVLAKPVRVGGEPNMNDECFVAVFRTARSDSLTVLRRHPTAVGGAVVDAWRISFMPSSLYGLLTENRAAIDPWERAYDGVIGFTILTPINGDRPAVRGLRTPSGNIEFSVTALASTVWILWAGGAAARRSMRRSGGRRRRRRDRPSHDSSVPVPVAVPVAVAVAVAVPVPVPETPTDEAVRAPDAVLLVLAVTVVVLAVTGNATEIGENNRFRFLTEPPLLAAFFLAIHSLVRRRFGSLAR